MANILSYNTASSKSLNGCSGEASTATDDETVTPIGSSKQRHRTLSLGGLASVSFMLNPNTNTSADGLQQQDDKARTFSGKMLMGSLGQSPHKPSMDLSQSPGSIARRVEPTSQPVKQSHSDTAPSSSKQETTNNDTKPGLFSMQLDRYSVRTSSITTFGAADNSRKQSPRDGAAAAAGSKSSSAVVTAFANLLTGRFFAFKK